MRIEWDEAKNGQTSESTGLDFADAVELFSRPMSGRT